MFHNSTQDLPPQGRVSGGGGSPRVEADGLVTKPGAAPSEKVLFRQTGLLGGSSHTRGQRWALCRPGIVNTNAMSPCSAGLITGAGFPTKVSIYAHYPASSQFMDFSFFKNKVLLRLETASWEELDRPSLSASTVPSSSLWDTRSGPGSPEDVVSTAGDTCAQRTWTGSCPHGASNGAQTLLFLPGKVQAAVVKIGKTHLYRVTDLNKDVTIDLTLNKQLLH